jgi:hypothetical protein
MQVADGPPQDLVRERGGGSMEETFIGYLAEAAGIDRTARVESPKPSDVTPESEAPVAATRSFDLARLWAYAWRETVELLRDPIRIAFALLGPIVLMAAFGYGISFDIENLQFAAFDQDNTPESQQLLDGFRGSWYFSVQPPITSAAEEEARSRGGGARLARLAGLYAYPKQTVLGKAPAEDGKPVSTFLKDDRFPSRLRLGRVLQSQAAWPILFPRTHVFPPSIWPTIWTGLPKAGKRCWRGSRNVQLHNPNSGQGSAPIKKPVGAGLTPWPNGLDLVAGAGFEPAAFRLWAWRATGLLHPAAAREERAEIRN